MTTFCGFGFIATRAVRRSAGLVSVMSLFAAIAALPAAPASAAGTPPEVISIPSISGDELLESIPLEALDVSDLAHLIAQQPGLQALPAATVEKALETTLQTLVGENSTVGALTQVSQVKPLLEEQLTKMLSLGELLTLLKGHSLSSVLTETLGSVEPSGLVTELVRAAANPEQLLGQALFAVDPGQLESTVGSALSGAPFSKTTAGELASSFGLTEQQLTEALGTSTEELPPSAMALTAPLAGGKTLGVLDGLEGLSFATLTPGQEEGGGGGGSGGNGSPGGPGGTGAGGGSSGGAPSTTIVIDATVVPGSSSPATHGAAAGKLRVIRHRVRRTSVALLVAAPGAGNLTVVGKGVKTVRRHTSEKERVTITTVLTKAGVAALRRRHHVRIRLRLTFQPIGSAASAASVTVALGR